MELAVAPSSPHSLQMLSRVVEESRIASSRSVNYVHCTSSQPTSSARIAEIPADCAVQRAPGFLMRSDTAAELDGPPDTAALAARLMQQTLQADLSVSTQPTLSDGTMLHSAPCSTGSVQPPLHPDCASRSR